MNLPTISNNSANPLSSSDPEPIIQLMGVSVRYRVPRERLGTFKEYMIRWVQRRVLYDEFLALKDVNLEVQRGEVFGLVGSNGAGKSTLLKVVARILRPTLGRVIVHGKVAPLLELGAGFHPELTGRENIYLYGALLGFDRSEMDQKYEQIVDFAELHQFIDAPLRTYSSGMTARLGFSVATANEPSILIVDEILSVGDEAFQQKSSAKIREFKEKGATILMVSHNPNAILANCQRAAWLDHGIIRGIGTPDEVLKEYHKNRVVERAG